MGQTNHYQFEHVISTYYLQRCHNFLVLQCVEKTDIKNIHIIFISL